MIGLLLSLIIMALPTSRSAVYEDGSYSIRIGTAAQFDGCVPAQPCALDKWGYAP